MSGSRDQVRVERWNGHMMGEGVLGIEAIDECVQVVPFDVSIVLIYLLPISIIAHAHQRIRNRVEQPPDLEITGSERRYLTTRVETRGCNSYGTSDTRGEDSTQSLGGFHSLISTLYCINSQVWADNLDEELDALRATIEKYPVVSMVRNEPRLWELLHTVPYAHLHTHSISPGHGIPRHRRSSDRNLSHRFGLPLPDHAV